MMTAPPMTWRLRWVGAMAVIIMARLQSTGFFMRGIPVFQRDPATAAFCLEMRRGIGGAVIIIYGGGSRALQDAAFELIPALDLAAQSVEKIRQLPFVQQINLQFHFAVADVEIAVVHG